MNIFELRRQQLSEGYTATLSHHLGDDPLVGHFAKHGKLTGYLTEDMEYLQEFRALLEADVDVPFDPFAHLTGTGKIEPSTDCVLSFSGSNKKLKYIKAVTFDLPAGYTCPFADICKSLAHRKGKKVFQQPGRKEPTGIKQIGDIRCYAASAEAQYKQTREMRWRNYDLLRQFGDDANAMADLIMRSLNVWESENRTIRVLRIHSSGDFFSQAYFDAWLETAKKTPRIVFYAYTKSLEFWQARKGEIPKNLRLIASAGGKSDELIDREGFRQAIILKDKGEAVERGLKIDMNDFVAAFEEGDFALLIHGPQAAGSAEGKASYANQKVKAELEAAKKLKVDPKVLDRVINYYASG